MALKFEEVSISLCLGIIVGICAAVLHVSVASRHGRPYLDSTEIMLSKQQTQWDLGLSQQMSAYSKDMP